MLIRSFSSEWYKIRHRKTLWVMMVIMGVIVAGTILAIYGGYRVSLSTGGAGNPQAEAFKSFITVPDVLSISIGMVGITGLILLVVLASGFISEDFRWGSIRTILATGVPRYDFLVSKALLICLSSFVFTLLGTIIAGLIGIAFTAGLSQPLPSGVTWAGFIKDMFWVGLKLGYSILPYGMLSVLIAVLTRGSGISVVIPLVSFFFIEPVLAQTVLPLLGETIANLATYLPSVCASTVQQGQGSEIWRPAAVLAVYAVVFLGAATYALEHKDIPAS